MNTPSSRHKEYDDRLREVERWQAQADGSGPALGDRLTSVETEVQSIYRLLRERDSVYNARFERLNRTIAWGAGALSALVFATQVILPLVQKPEPPQIIQIVSPAQKPAPPVGPN